MKTMTCRQLGGACDIEFRAETFEEMAQLSQQHGMEMHKANDQAHLEAMKAMQSLMANKGDMDAWYEGRRQAFDALPDSND